MKKSITLKIFILITLFIKCFILCIDTNAKVLNENNNISIKVGILTGVEKVIISNLDYKSSPEIKKFFLKNKIVKNNSLIISAKQNSIFINEKITNLSNLTIYPKKSSYIKVNNQSYRGIINIRLLDNKLVVINILSIEDYLRSVVPSEMEKNSNIEALKAQAVVARTYAMINKNKHQKLGYDLCNTTCCQVYKGMSEENSQTNKAVLETRGEVITYKNKLINAYYCSSCGGKTESISGAWSLALDEDYIQIIECPYCKKDTNTNWNYEISMKEFIRKLNNYGFMIKHIYLIEMQDISKSNRYSTLKIKSDLGILYLSSDILRKIIGNNKIRSLNFNIYIEKPKLVTNYFNFSEINDIIKLKANINNQTLQQTKIIFKGTGYGHGVGLCQNGAKQMAKLGKNYKEIIRYYFTDKVKINKIY